MSVKISDASDFGTVVNDLAVDVQHEFGRGVLGIRTFGRSARVPEILVGQRPHPGDPAVVLLVELGQCRVDIGGIAPTLVLGGRAAEMVVVAHREYPDDDVGQPPGDRRERLGPGRRRGEVDGAVRLNGPAAGHRFPEVLAVGEAVEARAQLVLPVPVELVGE